MRGLGTIINAAAVLAGGLLGLLLKKGLKPHLQEMLMQTMGLCTIFMGIAGALTGLLQLGENGQLMTTRSMILIGSLVLGGFAGELINIQRGLERFGEWLRRRAGAGEEASFLGAFVTASLTICVGAMAVVGSIQDGLTGDIAMLTAKAVLDAVIIMVYTSALGRGAIFSAIPLALFQGGITALAGLLAPLLTADVILGLSFVGSVLVFCVGANLAFDRKFRVANMLPALLVAAAAMALF